MDNTLQLKILIMSTTSDLTWIQNSADYMEVNQALYDWIMMEVKKESKEPIQLKLAFENETLN